MTLKLCKTILENGSQLTVIASYVQIMFSVQLMLTHFNPFQCSICGETGWLIFTNGVSRVRLWGVNFQVKMQVIDLYLCLECCSSRGVFSRIPLVETGYLVSLYRSNFMFSFIYIFIISFNFCSNFNIFLRNIKDSRRVCVGTFYDKG